MGHVSILASYFEMGNCSQTNRWLDKLLLMASNHLYNEFSSLSFSISGDNSPHDLWNETVEGQLSYTRYLVDRVASFLPGKPIYPALGNHGKGKNLSNNYVLIFGTVSETFPESEYLGTLPRYQVNISFDAWL